VQRSRVCIVLSWKLEESGADKLSTGKSILVPLTTSLYVPGTLADKENVIVDVGTGFYVEKVRDQITPG
jgi:prefoldin alpha subunit